MDVRTGVAVVVILGSLGTIAVAGFASAGADLDVRWISDTARDNRVNHHAVGVGPNGTVIAPVAEVAGTEGIGPTSCALVRLDPATGAVEWRVGVRPTNCTTHALTSPAIADKDADGTLEVITASTERALHVRSAATGDEHFRVSLASYGYGQPAVANLTAAAGAEIVVSDIEGEITMVSNRSAAWRVDLDSSTWAEPLVADADGDGEREIVLGTNDGTFALAADGAIEWRSTAEAVTTSLGPSSGDGRLILAAETGRVRAIHGTSGDIAWTYTVDGVANVGHVSADVPVPTAYVGISGGEVLAINAQTGEERWSTALVTADRQVTPPPVLGDVDGDGEDDLVAVVGDGTVAVLNPATGTQRATYRRDVPIWTRASLGDVDGDGAAELFIRYGDGRVVSLAYQ